MHVEPLVVARGILWFLGIEFRYHCNKTVDLQFIKKNRTKSCWIFLYEWYTMMEGSTNIKSVGLQLANKRNEIKKGTC
jgi:hypothetical protein